MEKFFLMTVLFYRQVYNFVKREMILSEMYFTNIGQHFALLDWTWCKIFILAIVFTKSFFQFTCIICFIFSCIYYNLHSLVAYIAFITFVFLLCIYVIFLFLLFLYNRDIYLSWVNNKFLPYKTQCPTCFFPLHSILIKTWPSGKFNQKLSIFLSINKSTCFL